MPRLLPRKFWMLMWDDFRRVSGAHNLLRRSLRFRAIVPIALQRGTCVGLMVAFCNCTSTVRDTRGNGGAESSSTGGTGGVGIQDGGIGGDPIFDPPPFPYYDGPVYDGDTECAPEVTPFARSTCCEGVPCHGACELHEGEWRCVCYGVDGGCGQFGLVCCKPGAGCKQEGACGLQ
jgi:hypothetical protein